MCILEKYDLQTVKYVNIPFILKQWRVGGNRVACEKSEAFEIFHFLSIV